MFSTAAEAGLFVFRKIADKWNKDSANMAAGMQSDSLIEYTQSARVEPIVLIDSDCLYLESLSEIRQSRLSIGIDASAVVSRRHPSVDGLLQK